MLVYLGLHPNLKSATLLTLANSPSKSITARYLLQNRSTTQGSDIMPADA